MTFPPRLIDGYRAFMATRLPLERSRFQKLAETGQHPEVMVICCCDSRVSPEVIFDAHPGELFVVRNVANLVPPYSPSGFMHGVSAALEFAVQCASDRLAERGLADSRRSDEAQYRSLGLRVQLQNAQVFEDALLDLFGVDDRNHFFRPF